MKNHDRILTLFIFFAGLVIPMNIYSQNYVLPDSVIITDIATNFTKQIQVYPQEKIYVQTDKPYYITGENIWFRVFLLDAQKHVPDTTSRYVYAELINPVDSIVSRVKIRPAEGVYQGYINIREDLPEGEYQLRFYTRFMQGLGEELFFKRSVRIGDPLTALYRVETKFEYTEKDKVNIEFRIIDVENDSPIIPDKIQIMDNKGELKQLKVNGDYTANTSLKISDKTGNKRQVYVEYDYGGKFHKEYICIPDQGDFEVSFMPEGGYNIVGITNRIAFKALNSNGLGEDIEGLIINGRGDTLDTFRSQHLGMGVLVFQQFDDSVFYAVCKNREGVEKKYQLPVAVTDRIALQVDKQTSRYTISLRAPYNKPLDDRSLHYVVIQCRGQILNVFKWDNNKPFVFLPKKGLPSGVIQFLLVDTNMNPVSERLIFNDSETYRMNVSFTTDKENYSKREQVKSSLKLTDYDNNPQIASFSVSVTDDKNIKPDTCVNILSTLLLTSDLKGYIESPAYYFSGNESGKYNKLDLVMMTHGWSRYDVKKILKGDFEKPKSYLELGQFISGTVKGGFFMNKKSEGYPVTLISLREGVFNQSFTNEEGKFQFQGFETPDSTSFIVQGLTKKGGNRVELLIDEEKFPESRFSLPFTSMNNRSLFEKYMQKADHNFVLTNGMRMIYLKDIEIIGQENILSKKRKSTFSSAMNPSVSHKEFEKYHPADIFQVLRNFAGVMVTGDKVSIRGGGDPLILIDDIQYGSDMLYNIPIQDVDEIEVVKDGTAAIFGMRGSNGAIIITTKRGEINYSRNDNFNLKKITPLGYQTTKEFYSPQYETIEQKSVVDPDLRTTIYWNPALNSDEEGKANISFYTSDTSTSYSVVIEGITIYGLPFYTVQKISRMD